jgi:lipoprotein-anchoring transpeptidase ErfK/SrfK
MDAVLDRPYVVDAQPIGHVQPPDTGVGHGYLALHLKAANGCVILSTEAARTIYDWAEIGTPVHIHY